MATAVDKKQEIVAGGQQGDTGGASVSLGKGAWDCDTNTEIPPEKEAYVFEEIATMDHPFEGIPTVPPRKDMDHMAFFCGGCRYRVTAYPDWTAQQVKEALFKGGIARSNKPENIRNTPGIQKWEDIELIYAGQRMENEKTLATYHVPPVRKKHILLLDYCFHVCRIKLCISIRQNSMLHDAGLQVFDSH